MSWISRWSIKDMKKWGGWHSLEERENYLLSEIERLEGEIDTLKIKNKLLDEKMEHVEERALSSVMEYFQKNVIIQHYENGYTMASKKGTE